MAYFYNDTPLPYIGKGDSHLLQHLPNTKVNAEYIPNTRLEAKESKKYRKSKIQVV